MVQCIREGFVVDLDGLVWFAICLFRSGILTSLYGGTTSKCLVLLCKDIILVGGQIYDKRSKWRLIPDKFDKAITLISSVSSVFLQCLETT